MFDITARLLLIIGGLNYLYFGLMNDQLIKNKDIYRIFTLVIGIIALYIGMNRDYYLPFLGNTVMIIPKDFNVQNGDIKIKLDNLPPNTYIVYWASNPNKDIFPDFVSAYGNTKNVGYIKSDVNGEVNIQIDCPGKYTVGMSKKVLPQHVHYRYEIPNKPGMFSRVYTKKLDLEC